MVASNGSSSLVLMADRVEVFTHVVARDGSVGARRSLVPWADAPDEMQLVSDGEGYLAFLFEGGTPGHHVAMRLTAEGEPLGPSIVVSQEQADGRRIQARWTGTHYWLTWQEERRPAPHEPGYGVLMSAAIDRSGTLSAPHELLRLPRGSLEAESCACGGGECLCVVGALHEQVGVLRVDLAGRALGELVVRPPFADVQAPIIAWDGQAFAILGGPSIDRPAAAWIWPGGRAGVGGTVELEAPRVATGNGAGQLLVLHGSGAPLRGSLLENPTQPGEVIPGLDLEPDGGMPGLPDGGPDQGDAGSNAGTDGGMTDDGVGTEADAGDGVGPSPDGPGPEVGDAQVASCGCRTAREATPRGALAMLFLVALTLGRRRGRG
jgi:MYXO-CTERM domain-containing protein